MDTPFYCVGKLVSLKGDRLHQLTSFEELGYMMIFILSMHPTPDDSLESLVPQGFSGLFGTRQFTRQYPTIRGHGAAREMPLNGLPRGRCLFYCVRKLGSVSLIALSARLSVTLFACSLRLLRQKGVTPIHTPCTRHSPFTRMSREHGNVRKIAVT